MSFKKFYVLLGVLFLTGCATADIVPLGQNTYMISQVSAAGVFTNTSKLKSDVILRANSFAKSQNKVAIPITSTAKSAIPGRLASFEYQFQLVDQDDPKASGNELRSTPDRINENRITIKSE